jgi:hypothetical protein
MLCLCIVVVLPQQLKEIEGDNIFFAKKGVRVAHQPTKKNSLDTAHDSDSDWEGLDGKAAENITSFQNCTLNNLWLCEFHN